MYKKVCDLGKRDKENCTFSLINNEFPPNLDNGSIFFVGNATVLIRHAGFTILTDPTFIHMHENLGYGLSSTRLTNPAIDIKDLPPIDLIVLSHFHGDILIR
jgi:L-ascorbate metabolism protein UlaG (beta-lactamase superfamily)